MGTKRLKVLIATMLVMLIFIMWYWQWHTEDIIIDNFSPVGELTWDVNTWAVSTWTNHSWYVDTWTIYTREMTENELVEKVNLLVGDMNISRSVVHECATQTSDYKLCIRNLLWVANAESSLFKKWMYPSHNPFWLMQRTSKGYIKRRFNSVESAIHYWVSLYVKKWWGKRTTWDARLRGKYCTSQCSNWTKAYNSVQKKLKLD